MMRRSDNRDHREYDYREYDDRSDDRRHDRKRDACCDSCKDKYQADGDRRCKDDKLYRCRCRYDREPTPPPPPFPIPEVSVGSSSFTGPTVAATIPTGGIIPVGATTNITTGSGVLINSGGGAQFSFITPGRYIVHARTPVIAGATGGQVTLSINGVVQPSYATVVPPGPGASQVIVAGIVPATAGTTVSLVNYGATPLVIPATVDGVQAYSGMAFIKLSP